MASEGEVKLNEKQPEGGATFEVCGFKSFDRKKKNTRPRVSRGTTVSGSMSHILEDHNSVGSILTLVRCLAFSMKRAFVQKPQSHHQIIIRSDLMERDKIQPMKRLHLVWHLDFFRFRAFKSPVKLF